MATRLRLAVDTGDVRGAAAAAPTPPKKSGQAYAVARLCGYCGRTGAKNQCGKCGSLGPRFCGPACFNST